MDLKFQAVDARRIAVRSRYAVEACVRCKRNHRRCDRVDKNPCTACLRSGVECRSSDDPTQEDLIAHHNVLARLEHLKIEADQVTGRRLISSRQWGFWDIYAARYEKHNIKVAIKRLRFDSYGAVSRVTREMHTWSKLKHDNILPLLSYVIEDDNLNGVPSLVSEWMRKGSLDNYMKELPRGGEELCSIFSQITSGVSYLHSLEIVHGNLRASNVLISNKGAPLIFSFELSRNVTEGGPLVDSSSTSRTPRWMAPELFTDLLPQTSKMTDVWALGMIGYELMSWRVPYFSLGDVQVILAITDGRLPDKPEETENIQVFNFLWTICNVCWKEQSMRLSVDVIGSLLEPFVIAVCGKRETGHLGSNNSTAQSEHTERIESSEDTLKSAEDNSGLFRAMLVPLSRFNISGLVEKLSEQPLRAGGFSDVHVAKMHGKKVAVKRVRCFLKRDITFAKKFLREIWIWAELVHENVLPLLGYYFIGNEMMPNLVSEWMEDGTLDEYTRKIDWCCRETCKLLHGVLSGLAYLHSKSIIHADLKSSNILVSPQKKPLLADFGLSSLQQTHSIMGMVSASSNRDCKGSLRWLAPELLIVAKGDSPKHDGATDMWALGMVAYEMLSGNLPYASVNNDFAVLRIIQEKILPTRPTPRGEPPIIELIWSICCSCWNFDPKSRPNAEQAVHRLSADLQRIGWCGLK